MLPAIPSFESANRSLALIGNYHDVLVQVPLAGGVVYLNDTDQYAHLGATSHDGNLAVLLTDAKPMVVHATKGSSGKTEEDFRISVGNSGNTRITITRRFFGADYGLRKKFFTELPPEERNRYYQQVVASVSQGARPVGALMTRFDGYPGVESFTVDVNAYAIRDGNYLYFDLPADLRLFPTATDLRAQPFYLPRPVVRIIRSEVTFPSKDWHILIAPKSRDVAAADGSGRVIVDAREQPGGIAIEHRLSIDPSIVQATDYPALVRLENSLEDESARAIVVDTGAAAPAPQPATKAKTP